MTGIFIMVFYALACVGAGLLAMRAIAGHRWSAVCVSGMPLLSSGFVVGQAILAAFWVMIALAGWFRLQVVAGISLLLLVAGLPLLVPLARAAWQDVLTWVKWLWAESIFLRIIAIVLLVLVLGFGWAAWVMPPIGDAEAFYVTYARIIASVEKLEPMPGIYETFSSIGLMGELHFAALIKLSGVPAAKLFVWLLGLVAAMFLAAICGVAGVKRTGQLLVWALLFTSTTFTAYLFDGKVDLFAATLGLAAVFWVLVSSGKGQRRVALAIGGLCTGFAVVAKFSYALGFVPAIVTLIVLREMAGSKAGSGKMRDIVWPVMVFGLWAALAVVPHLIKNAVMFGAPLAPFIGGGGDQNWLQQVWFDPEVTRRILLTYPLALVFAQYPMQGGNLSWLWLALLPLVWWLPKPDWRSSVIVQLCAAGMIGTVMWMIFRPSIIAPRYLLTTLLLFYPLVAMATEQIVTREIVHRWLSLGIAAAIFTALLAAARYPLGIMVRDTIREPDKSCAFASPYCEPLSKLSREADAGDRVYFAAYYSYWLRDDLLQCRDQGMESKEALLSWEPLVSGGFQWLVVDMSSHSGVWKNLSALPKPDSLKAQIFWDSQDMLILKLDDEHKAGRAACLQLDAPAWALVRASSE